MNIWITAFGVISASNKMREQHVRRALSLKLAASALVWLLAPIKVQIPNSGKLFAIKVPGVADIPSLVR